MKRFFHWILIPSLLILTLSLFPSEQADAYSALFTVNLSAQDVISEVNILRASKNLPPYKVDSILMTVAQSHADYIASTGVVTHFSESGARPYQRAITAGYSVAGDLSAGGFFAENIYSGAAVTPSELLEIWQDDPNDLNAMLSPDFTDAGTGVAVENGITYYVLDVGASTETPTVIPVSSALVSATPGTQSAPVITNTPLEGGDVYHIVQPNEALWSIALAYNTTIEQLKLLNGLATDEIFSGQKLLISKEESKTATPEIVATATFGIPSSTATMAVAPTITSTVTPLPTAPISRRKSGIILGIIILIALAGAGIGSWLGRKKPD